MGRGKDEFIERTGGFRADESRAEFHARVEEIDRLEVRFRQSGLTMEEREAVQRRLCALKGIDFDAPDDDED
jgi:hypothetical protein